MKKTVAALISEFETWAPPTWQESWDNCGWQIQPGILSDPAGVLVCLTPTLAVMAEAIALQQRGIPVNLIFAHHPLIFSPLKSVKAADPVGEMVLLAIRNGIGVYSAHTNFDQVADGTADILAQKLGLQEVTPVVPTQPGVGYGRVGNLSEPVALQTQLTQIQTVLSPPKLLHSPGVDLQEPVQRVAVLGGSGASFIDEVADTGAQVYLTSDCKFHQFQTARDRGLILMDAGHYATERPACQRLVTRFEKQDLAWVGLSDRDEDFRQFFPPEP